MSNSTQNDEIKQMERAINEGFAESEKDLRDKRTPLDKSSTQNDWEKRYEEFITFVTNEKNWIDGRPVWKEYKYVTLANAIKYFIRKELADARREGHELGRAELVEFEVDKERKEVISKVEKELKEVQFIYEHQWTGSDEERLCETCREVVKKRSPCRASSHYSCWRVIEDVLATLREEEEER